MRISANCKDLAYMDIVNEHLIHRKRLTKVSSRIDNSSPLPRKHLLKDLKGKSIKVNKQDEIDTCNKILVDKILKVISRDVSTQRSCKEGQNWKMRKIVDPRISVENSRVLKRLNESKAHYSCERMRKEYKHSTNLKKMLLKHSGRLNKYMKHSLMGESLNYDRNKSNRSLNNTLTID